MTRRQAENLAKGNPRVAERLSRGEYDIDSGGTPRKPREPAPGKPRKKAVSAGAPPGRPRARSGKAQGGSRSSQEGSGGTRAPRRSRDNGDPEKPRGLFRSIIDGLFDI